MAEAHIGDEDVGRGLATTAGREGEEGARSARDSDVARRGRPLRGLQRFRIVGRFDRALFRHGDQVERRISAISGVHRGAQDRPVGRVAALVEPLG